MVGGRERERGREDEEGSRGTHAALRLDRLAGGGHEKGRKGEDGGRRKGEMKKFSLSTALLSLVVVYADKSQGSRKDITKFSHTSRAWLRLNRTRGQVPRIM